MPLKNEFGLSRRQLLKSSCVIAAGSGMTPLSLSGAWAQETIEDPKFAIAGVRDPQLGAQVIVASYFKLFATAGLDPQIDWHQSAGDVLVTMGSGSVPVGTASPLAVVILHAQNVPVKMIAGIADITDTQGLVLRPGLTLSHPRELEGKRIVHTEGNIQILMLSKLAKMYDFDTKKVQLININQSEGVVAAAGGEVDGLLGWQPNLFRVVQAGGKLFVTGRTLFFGDASPKVLPGNDQLLYASTMIMAQDSWMKKNPNTAKAFLGVMEEANKILVSDKKRAMEALLSEIKVSPDVMEVMMDANRYKVGLDENLKNAFDFQNQWALNIKRIPTLVQAKDCVDASAMKSVNAGAVSWNPGG